MPTLAAYLMEGSGRGTGMGTGTGTPEADAVDAGGLKDESMRGVPNVDTFTPPPAEGSQVAGSPSLKAPV